LGTAFTLVGLLASILVGLKNSSGQPLIGAAASTAITAGESLVTSIIADIQAAHQSGATSATAVQDDLATMQALLTALKSQKVLSANTVQLINALDNAIGQALIAEQQSQTATNPSTLTPIAQAQ
jgi:hypothetical protein